MLQSGSRYLACIALVSCLAVASWGCCSAEKAAGVVLVAVSSNVQAHDGSTPAKPAIYCHKKQQLIWIAAPGQTLTKITIPLGGNPTPFKNCASGSDPCVIKCYLGVCVSGPVFDGIKCPDKDIYYDYLSAFAAAGEADPGFIIRP